MTDEQPVTGDEPGESDCRNHALKFLARREYSVVELGRKLRRKGYPGAMCDRVLAGLVDQDLISDRRYAEAYLEVKIRKGFGPMRIRKSLEEAGVDKDIIDAVMNATEVEWREQLWRQHQKKYGDSKPETYKEWVKRARYLNDRGFSSDLIQSVLDFNT